MGTPTPTSNHGQSLDITGRDPEIAEREEKREQTGNDHTYFMLGVEMTEYIDK